MAPQWTVSLQILESCAMFRVILSGKYRKDTDSFMRDGNNHESIPDIFKTGKLVKIIVDFLPFLFFSTVIINCFQLIFTTDPLLFLTPLSMSCSCILSHVLHSVPCRPRGTKGAGGRRISSNPLSLIVSPVTHLTTVRSSSSLVLPCDIRGSFSFFVVA